MGNISSVNTQICQNAWLIFIDDIYDESADSVSRYIKIVLLNIDITTQTQSVVPLGILCMRFLTGVH